MANPNPNEITRFKPGEEWRGNAGGRPKGRSLASILRQAMEDGTDFDGNPLPEGKTVADFVVTALIRHAMGGDASMMKQLWDRHDGTAIEKVESKTETRIIVEHVDGGSSPIAGAEAPRGTADDPPGDAPVQRGELRPEVGEDGSWPESVDSDRG